MKRGMLLLCLIICFVCGGGRVYAEATPERKVYGEFEYTYDSKRDCIWIVKYHGNREVVAVPALIDGKKVCYLNNIFRNNKTIKRVQLPDTLVAISSFNGCTALEEINIPENVEWIPEYTFYGCNNLKHVQLPDNLRSIDRYAFAGCQSLVEVVMPDTLEEIGKNAFADCRNLQKLTLSAKISCIPERAFFNCKKIKQIRIPKGVVEIGREAFADCTMLGKVELPSTLCDIQAYAFENCSMKEIVLPGKISYLDEGCFSNCRKLRKIVIKSKQLWAYTDRKLAFYNINPKAVFDVPNAYILKYEEWLTKTDNFKPKTMKIK